MRIEAEIRKLLAGKEETLKTDKELYDMWRGSELHISKLKIRIEQLESEINLLKWVLKD